MLSLNIGYSSTRIKLQHEYDAGHQRQNQSSDGHGDYELDQCQAGLSFGQSHRLTL